MLYSRFLSTQGHQIHKNQAHSKLTTFFKLQYMKKPNLKYHQGNPCPGQQNGYMFKFEQILNTEG